MNLQVLMLIIYGTIKRGYFVNPFLLYSQARLETGNFKSAIYKENHNLFGMKQARIRENLATGTNRAHATYKNRLHSVEDYVLRQKYFRIKATYFSPTTYINDTVNSNYAEDPNYANKWNTLYKEHKTSGTLATIALLLLPLGTIGVLVWYLIKKR